MSWEDVFEGVPLSWAVWNRWDRLMDQTALHEAAWKLHVYGANPWVFTGDRRMFEQFASGADFQALNSLTDREFEALLGEGW